MSNTEGMSLSNAEFMRQFDTGATRDIDINKLDFDGFFSPLVMKAFAEYMNFNRQTADGNTRTADNWQKGIPMEVYRSSAWRHFFDLWCHMRPDDYGHVATENVMFAACGVLFNVQGWLHEMIKQHPDVVDYCLDDARHRRAAGVILSRASRQSPVRAVNTDPVSFDPLAETKYRHGGKVPSMPMASYEDAEE